MVERVEEVEEAVERLAAWARSLSDFHAPGNEARATDIRTILSALSERTKALERFKRWADTHEHAHDDEVVEVRMEDFRIARKALGDPDHG